MCVLCVCLCFVCVSVLLRLVGCRRFAPDSGVAMGLIGVPCLLASLLLLHSNNGTTHIHSIHHTLGPCTSYGTLIVMSHHPRNPLISPPSPPLRLTLLPSSLPPPPVLLRSLLHASLLCSGSVALQHLACLPISDIPSRSTPLTRISTLGAKLAILAVRLLLPWPDRPFSVLALLVHEALLWGVVEVPLFTASFTLGEAMMIVQALALTTADALCCTALEVRLLALLCQMVRSRGPPIRRGGKSWTQPSLCQLNSSTCALLIPTAHS